MDGGNLFKWFFSLFEPAVEQPKPAEKEVKQVDLFGQINATVAAAADATKKKAEEGQTYKEINDPENVQKFREGLEKAGEQAIKDAEHVFDDVSKAVGTKINKVTGSTGGAYPSRSRYNAYHPSNYQAGGAVVSNVEFSELDRMRAYLKGGNRNSRRLDSIAKLSATPATPAHETFNIMSLGALSGGAKAKDSSSSSSSSDSSSSSSSASGGDDNGVNGFQSEHLEGVTTGVNVAPFYSDSNVSDYAFRAPYMRNRYD